MNRLAQIKSGCTNKDSGKLQQNSRTESCPGPTPPSSPNGQGQMGESSLGNAGDVRKHSLPDPKSSNASKQGKASPKAKTKLFDSFRNPLKSKSTKLKWSKFDKLCHSLNYQHRCLCTKGAPLILLFYIYNLHTKPATVWLGFLRKSWEWRN